MTLHGLGKNGFKSLNTILVVYEDNFYLIVSLRKEMKAKVLTK